MIKSKKQLITAVPLNWKTVVIIGASSGIGRATALAFAEQGSDLVLVARRENVLHELATACLEKGASNATAIRADVTIAQTLANVVNTTLARSGKIDVWINNVGAGAVGEFTEIPLEVHEQIIKTSLLGHFNGAYAVLPVFKEQGYGVMINTISVGGWVPEPYAVAYTASKFGLRGFSESLRCELLHWPGIAVCDVFPAYIDTPGFQHAANYTGKKLKPIPPVFPAIQVAKTMVALAKYPRDAVTVGPTAGLFKLLNAAAPSLLRKALTGIMDNYFKRAKPAPVSNGHIFESSPMETGVSGDWLPVDHGNIRPIVWSALITGAIGAFLLIRKVF